MNKRINIHKAFKIIEDDEKNKQEKIKEEDNIIYLQEEKDRKRIAEYKKELIRKDF